MCPASTGGSPGPAPVAATNMTTTTAASLSHAFAPSDNYASGSSASDAFSADAFATLDFPSPQLTAATVASVLKSFSTTSGIKLPRTAASVSATANNPGFSRDGILGSAEKARTMSAQPTSLQQQQLPLQQPPLSSLPPQPQRLSHPPPPLSIPMQPTPPTAPTLSTPLTSDLSLANGPANGHANGHPIPTGLANGHLKTDENPLKRRNADQPVDYPRRRATIACEVCRSRKSRCDGTKPKCKLCTELGAECIYREPGIKLDAGDKLILERLNRIEGMLQLSLANQSAAQTSAAAAAAAAAAAGFNLVGNVQQDSPSIAGMSSTSATGMPPFSGAPDRTTLGTTIGTWPGVGVGTGTGAGVGAGAGSTNDFVSVSVSAAAALNNVWVPTPIPTPTNIPTMPKVHNNAALHLLQWPLIRDLISRPYDPQILLQLEMAREPLPSLAKTPCVDLSNTTAYIEAYFSRVNVWYACVNPYTWRSHYRTALSNGFREGPESCIVLLVLALGQASLRGSISRIVPHEDPPGLPYFTAAWALLPGMMTANSVLAAQCHLLAAAYLFYLVRPLEAWNLLCTTSTKLQLLLMAPALRIPSDQRELTERIYWNALLFESDLLAELDLPHSGVVQFEENVGLPCGFTDSEHPNANVDANANPNANTNSDNATGSRSNGTADDLWYFLAEIALRRLLNRVSQLLYSQETALTTTSSPMATAATVGLGPIVAELDYQLTQWYESLPRPLQFAFERSSPSVASEHEPPPPPGSSAAVQTVLRLRFFACRTIIYRPYILAVLDNEQAVLDPAVRDACHTCLEAAVRQLEDITQHHTGHMPYLWQGALSIVSQTLLLMGASLSPSLCGILLSVMVPPHRSTLDRIIADVLAEMDRYAVLAPSLQLAAEIVREAEARRRACIGG